MPELRNVALLSKEYPPTVYGGSGVHVHYLSQELARIIPVHVLCFGNQRIQDGNLRVTGYPAGQVYQYVTSHQGTDALDALARCVAMVDELVDIDIVHCHDWSTCMAGFLARKLFTIPLVVTVHSLEPLRPWKVEQLGTGYHLSSWMEKTTLRDADIVIAVSEATRQDILRLFSIPPEKVHVIHNGVDVRRYCKATATDALVRHGIAPERPYVLFVGRITRQKGIIHLLNAVKYIAPLLQIVFCAGASDTESIRREMIEKMQAISANREGMFWIEKPMQEELIQLYSHAAVLCCPSVYEPLGIVNLEAMACETAVVATAVGGIPEAVVPGGTGLLVKVQLKADTGEPVDANRFSRDLAMAINYVALDRALQETYGRNGRKRVEEHFEWTTIAHKTLDLYRSVLR